MNIKVHSIIGFFETAAAVLITVAFLFKLFKKIGTDGKINPKDINNINSKIHKIFNARKGL